MNDLALRLKNVYWLGGGSRAGKSTIAHLIATDYGFDLYETDESMTDHARRARLESEPLLTNFKAMDMDERWVHRSPSTMLDTFPWFHGECFDMMVDDLLKMSVAGPVIVEGFRLLPSLVAPLLANPNQAVWLLPTNDYRRRIVETTSGSRWEFLQKTSDPRRALENVFERDRMFTDRLAQEIGNLGLSSITVDGTMNEDQSYKRVRQIFGLT